MEDRVFVGDHKTTQLFLDEVKEHGKFKSWKTLQTFLGISRGYFWYIQTGRRSFSQTGFEKLLGFLPLKRQEYYTKIIRTKPADWGRSLAGKITYSKHKEMFDMGRKIGLKKMKHQPKYVDTMQPLTEDLCEFLGAFAGDGFTNKYGKHYLIGFTGNRQLDFDYYQTRIIPIAKKLFNSNPSIFQKENFVRVNFYSKLLFELLTERFQLPRGIKFNKVTIPLEIQNSKLENILAFIRGAFDTDGCVFFDNRKIYKEPYLRLDLTMYNPTILDQIASYLQKAGIEAKRLANGRHLQITSKKDVKRYLATVGTSNQRHIAKILKKFPEFNEFNPAFKRNNLDEKSVQEPF